MVAEAEMYKAEDDARQKIEAQNRLQSPCFMTKKVTGEQLWCKTKTDNMQRRRRRQRTVSFVRRAPGHDEV